MPCIECHSSQTSLERRDDGHYHKHCDECGHDWGPFISSYDEPHETEAGSSEQGTLDGWAPL